MSDSFQPYSRAQSGVTITELLVVVVVIGVICGFALMQGGGSNVQFKRQSIAQELKTALERARFDSVKRRADGTIPQARVVINETSFTLTTDQNQDGVLDSSDDQPTTFSGQNIVIGLDDGAAFPVTVIYTQRGEAIATSASLDMEPVFWVCNVSCASPDDANANIVLVTPTGTVNLLPGSSSPPTFSSPTGLTSVPPSNSINNTAAVTPTPGP
jgi:prepilin-type N-terminal cleavage/methylation domain-containing protein